MIHLRSPHAQRTEQRRYAKRPFRNPYFPSKTVSRWKLIAIAAAVAIVCIGAATFFLSHKAFAIRTVHVEGNETVATDALVSAVQAHLDARVLWVLRRSNRFLFDPARLKADLNVRFGFDGVVAERKGTALDVRVRERQSQLLWRAGDTVALVDDTGKAVRPLTAEEIAGLSQPDPPPSPGQTISPMARLKRLRVFTDVNQAAVAPGDAVLKPEEVNGARAFEQHLLDMAIPFTEVRVDRQAGTWMAAKTLAGYDILFDPQGDVGGQALRLATLFRDTVKDTRGLSYVDLRFGDHVYYK